VALAAGLHNNTLEVKVSMDDKLTQRIEGLMKDYFSSPPGWWMYVRQGKVTKIGGQTWLKHFFHFASNFPRWLGNVAGACPHLPVRMMLIRNMWDEEVADSRAGKCHVELLIQMGEALGLTRQEILATPMLPETTVAINVWENLTRNRTWIEGMAALQVLERTNDENLAKKFGLPPQLGLNPWERLGLTKKDTEFIWVHVEADKEHAGGEAMALTTYARTPEIQEKVLEVSRESLAAWKLYNNAIYNAIPREER
jgi:pyrroloquinoline-quinone synthase